MSVIGCFLKTTCTFGFFFFFFSPSGKVSLFVSVETAGMLASSPHVCVCVVVVRSVQYLTFFNYVIPNKNPSSTSSPSISVFYYHICATHACRSTSNPISPPPASTSPPLSHFLKGLVEIQISMSTVCRLSSLFRSEDTHEVPIPIPPLFTFPFPPPHPL